MATNKNNVLVKVRVRSSISNTADEHLVLIGVYGIRLFCFFVLGVLGFTVDGLTGSDKNEQKSYENKKCVRVEGTGMMREEDALAGFVMKDMLVQNNCG